MRLKLLPVLLFTAVTAFAQTSKDFAVLLTAQVQESPANITLKWPADNTSGVTYNIYRKAKNAGTVDRFTHYTGQHRNSIHRCECECGNRI
jgi:hypothetical protein